MTTMMNEKMAKNTKAMKFEALRDILTTCDINSGMTAAGKEIGAGELVEFINHELELLAKRNTGEKKLTKTQQENEAFAEKVAEFICEGGEKFRCGDIAEHFEVSGQKMNAILKKLVDAGRIAKTVEKKVSFFHAVEVEGE